MGKAEGGKAKEVPDGLELELERVERWTAALGRARARKDEKAMEEAEGLLERAGRDVARRAGAQGWEWLGWSFSGRGDAGQAATAYVRNTSGRHPGLGAARSGEAEQLRILLERGCPAEVNLRGMMRPDLGHLAAKARMSGGWEALRGEALKGLGEGREKAEEARQQLMGWISGCADALWAEGIRECAEDFRRAFPKGTPELYWKATFGSPMEGLLYNDEGEERPEEALECLREMLKLAPARKWPMEREGEEFRETLFEGDDEERPSFFMEAAAAGAFWAIEDLFDPERDGDEERTMEEIRRGNVENGWSDRPKAGAKTQAKLLELFAGAKGAPAKRGARRKKPGL